MKVPHRSTKYGMDSAVSATQQWTFRFYARWGISCVPSTVSF